METVREMIKICNEKCVFLFYTSISDLSLVGCSLVFIIFFFFVPIQLMTLHTRLTNFIELNYYLCSTSLSLKAKYTDYFPLPSSK